MGEARFTITADNLASPEVQRVIQILRQMGVQVDETGRIFNRLNQEITGRGRQALIQQAQAADQAAKSHATLGNSFSLTARQALTYAAALTGVHIGLQSVGQVLRFAAESSFGFENKRWCRARSLAG